MKEEKNGEINGVRGFSLSEAFIIKQHVCLIDGRLTVQHWETGNLCWRGIMLQVGVGVDVFSEGDKCQLSKVWRRGLRDKDKESVTAYAMKGKLKEGNRLR